MQNKRPSPEGLIAVEGGMLLNLEHVSTVIPHHASKKATVTGFGVNLHADSCILYNLFFGKPDDPGQEEAPK